MTNRTAQQGMTLLESLLVLMALVTLMTLCATVLQQRCEQAKAVAAAQQLKAVAQAAYTYAEDHAAQFSPGTLSTLPLQVLIDQGYLPRNFPPKNSYQQHYEIQVVDHKTLAQRQVWAITEKGEPIPPRDWRSIAPLLGTLGAYYNQKTDRLIGWQATWDESAKAVIKPGHLVLYHPVQTPAVCSTDALLSRKKIPKHPQRQQMNTNLDLQQHAIVFGSPQHQGKMSGQGLQFEQTTATETHHATLGFIQPGGEPVPQITLQTSKQNRLQISPASLHITGPSLFASRDKPHKRKFHYNIQDKSITSILHYIAAPAHCGSQLHREWSQLPYHHLSRHSSQKNSDHLANFQKSAHDLCQPDKDRPLAPLGRLFIIGNIYHQQSTLFVCGKIQAGREMRPWAYPIYSTPTFNPNNTLNQSDKEIIKKIKITGFKLKDTANKDIQEMTSCLETLLNELETLHFVLTLEALIIKAEKAEKSERTTFCEKQKKLINFHNKLKENKKKYTEFKELEKSEFYKETLKSDGEYENIYTQMKDKCHYKNINKGFDSFFKYCLRQKLVYTEQQNKVTFHCDFLKSIILNLQGCLDPKNSPSLQDMKKVLNTERMNKFLKQCEDFSKLNDSYWMQTVFVLCPSMEHHTNLFAMIATPAAANRLE